MVSLIKLITSFRGRFNRAKFWLFQFVALGMFGFGLLIIEIGDGPTSLPPMVLAVFAVVLACIVVALLLIASIRRLHDRDKSWRWLLLFYLVPGVAEELAVLLRGQGPDELSLVSAAWLYLVAASFSIWGFVELGCLRGTEGPNRYGSDPLERAQEGGAAMVSAK